MGERVGGDVEAINRSREGLFRAFNAADAESFVASVADDVVWMSHSGPPPTIGKEAVRSSYKEFFERGPFVPHVRGSSDEVVVSGDWAFDRGTWFITRTYKRGFRRERLESCHVMIWRRPPGGAWKLARLIWNGAPGPVKAPTTGSSRSGRGSKRCR